MQVEEARGSMRVTQCNKGVAKPCACHTKQHPCTKCFACHANNPHPNGTDGRADVAAIGGLLQKETWPWKMEHNPSKPVPSIFNQTNLKRTPMIRVHSLLCKPASAFARRSRLPPASPRRPARADQLKLRCLLRRIGV